MDLQTFQHTVQTHRQKGWERFLVPVYRRKSADLLTPVSAFLLLRQGASHPVLLESVEGGERLGRYSFLARDPYRIIRSRGTQVEIRTGEAVEHQTGSIYEVMKEQMAAYREVVVPELPRLTGGAIGYMGYDTVRLLERLPQAPPDDLALPDAIWAFYRTVVAFDHVRHQLVLMAQAVIEPDTEVEAAYEEAVRELDRMECLLEQTQVPRPEPVRLLGALRANMARETFEQAVERARHYIYEGDIFQVVLSQRFEMDFSGDAFNLYRALRQVNPSPYLYYLDFEDVSLIGSSPEVLVRMEGQRAEVLPIAGTRPRGRTPEEDRMLEEELLADPKERAEHLMLVDLGRNDLGRVSSYGSVQVDRYAYIERYSHVMHIVSSVSGRVRPELSPLDVLAACFPAGTVSGAPKVRAMEIIDELEPVRRGIYAGAVGYMNHAGNMDTCIAIRTMVVRDSRAYIQAGAGIVADSIPAREYEETENKARALYQSLLLAGEGLL